MKRFLTLWLVVAATITAALTLLARLLWFLKEYVQLWMILPGFVTMISLIITAEIYNDKRSA